MPWNSKKYKEYYEKNREKIRERAAQQYYKHREKTLQKKRIIWNKRTPEEKALWLLNHKEKQNLYLKRFREKSKKLLSLLIGNQCVICESPSSSRISFHEIHGNEHKRSYTYYEEHFRDFIPLCNKHHRMLHWCFEVDINQILELLKLMKL